MFYNSRALFYTCRFVWCVLILPFVVEAKPPIGPKVHDYAVSLDDYDEAEIDRKIQELQKILKPKSAIKESVRKPQNEPAPPTQQLSEQKKDAQTAPCNDPKKCDLSPKPEALKPLPVPPQPKETKQAQQRPRQLENQRKKDAPREQRPQEKLDGQMCLPAVDGLSRFDYSTFDQKQRPYQFIWQMAPVAVEIQEKTGLPASVFLAQAAIESASSDGGWGMGKGYKERNSLFGHSCCFNGRNCQIDREFSMVLRNGEKKTVWGKCDTWRPRGEGGKYVTFSNLKDSAWAYAHILLYSPRTAGTYGAIRAAVAKSAPKVADLNEVLGGLNRYAAGAGYQSKLSSIIESKNLKKYDKMRMCPIDGSDNFKGV